MKKTTANWLLSSQYDLRTAETLFKNKRYIYVVFMCHLSLEKTLIELGDITLPENYKAFVDKVNLQSVPTRYPEDFRRLSKEFDRKIAEDYLKQSKGIIT